MTVFDTTLNSWVNPKTLVSVGVPAGAGSSPTLDTVAIQADLPKYNLLPVSSGFAPIVLTPTPTAPVAVESHPTSTGTKSPDLLVLVIFLGAIFGIVHPRIVRIGSSSRR